MSIIRIQRNEKSYVILLKPFLDDRSISCGLKGFLMFMCQQTPDCYNFSKISKFFKEDENTIYSIIDEGIKHGYIVSEEDFE